VEAVNYDETKVSTSSVSVKDSDAVLDIRGTHPAIEVSIDTGFVSLYHCISVLCERMCFVNI